MAKLLIGILALAGSVLLINIYASSLWSDGFVIKGHLLSYGLILLGIVGYLVYKIRSS